MNDSTRKGIRDLRDALSTRGSNARLEVASPEELQANSEFLSMNTALREWYAAASPRDFRINFFQAQLQMLEVGALACGQVGYRYASVEDRSIFPQWDSNWLVIGTCNSDPLIADLADPSAAVLVAVHGTGKWNPKVVAQSLGQWLTLLAIYIEAEESESMFDEDEELSVEFLERLKSDLAGALPQDCIKNLLEYVTF